MCVLGDGAYHCVTRFHLGNIPAMSVPVNTMPDQTLPKPTLKEYRQKLMTINARIRNREQAIKRFRKHLKNDTFPKRMKSIKPHLKMEYPESRTMVNAASDQVQSVILVCILQEEEKNSSKIKIVIKRY